MPEAEKCNSINIKWGKPVHRLLKWHFVLDLFSKKPTKDNFVVSKEMLNSHLQWKRGLRVFLSPLVINYPRVNIGHRRGMVSQRCVHTAC